MEQSASLSGVKTFTLVTIPENLNQNNLSINQNNLSMNDNSNNGFRTLRIDQGAKQIKLNPIFNPQAASTIVVDDESLSNKYGEYNHLISKNERSILPDLKNHSYSDDIKNRADLIYNKMYYRVRRKKIRHKMLFYCVYNAHLELGLDVNPIELGKDFGLEQGDVQKTDSMFSPLQTGYHPPSIIATPMGYLPDYCDKMQLSQDCVYLINQMATNILQKDPSLFQENPQTVAAGLLRYFIITNGIQCDDPQKIAKVTSRSNVTIDSIYRRIATIDNN